MRLLILLLISQMAMSQTLITQDGDYIEVPEGKRAVFINKEMPLEHCAVICTSPVEEPVVEPTEPDCCPAGELCFSPSVSCDPDVVYCDENKLAVSPAVCTPRPD